MYIQLTCLVQTCGPPCPAAQHPLLPDRSHAPASSRVFRDRSSGRQGCDTSLQVDLPGGLASSPLLEQGWDRRGVRTGTLKACGGPSPSHLTPSPPPRGDKEEPGLPVGGVCEGRPPAQIRPPGPGEGPLTLSRPSATSPEPGGGPGTNPTKPCEPFAVPSESPRGGRAWAPSPGSLAQILAAAHAASCSCVGSC